ncbi:MAG TPA: hypothetical protein VJR89_28680 [Polyangiales bacterium]|nr:hypothetical protein [Polyangiales bacterium]
MSRAALLGLLVLLTAAGVEAQATRTKSAGAQTASDDQEARDLFKLGKQAFDEGRFERALKYFKDAYELSHRAALLSNIGTVLDRLRRDEEALQAYKSYLEQVPDAANRSLVEERVRVIEAAMQRSAEPQPEAAPSPVPTPEQTAQAELARTPPPNALAEPQAKPQDSPSITSRWWFWAGLGTVAAAAVVVGVAANSGGGGDIVQGPVLLNSATRVREL